MATGYIATAGDLDVLFKARTSAAIANTNFKSNGGVDLAQRFEPRGSTTARANTNFMAGANDLASLFMDIAGGVIETTHTLVAGTNTPSQIFGFHDGSGAIGAFGSCTPGGVGGFGIGTISYQVGSISQVTLFQAGVYPPNTDSTWQAMDATGVFANSSGATVTRTVTRAANTGTADTVNGGQNRRTWNFAATVLQFITGNTYTIKFRHT